MIYLARCSGFSPAFFDAAVKALPKEKQASVALIRHRQTKEQTLLGWSMVALLRERMGCSAHAPLRFSAHGKPYYDDTFHFNLSHSGDTVCLAVADAPVGVDVQTLKTPSDALVRRVLCPNERAALSAAKDPALAFTMFWTMKESWLKLCGTGIIDDLTALDFSPQLNADAFSFESAQFTVFRTQTYVLTACGAVSETAIRTLNASDFQQV